MSKNSGGPGVRGNPSAPLSAASKPANPEALAVVDGAAHLDIHEFVQQLMVRDKIILDYLKQSETKSGG